jgi:hypothetical protein
MFSLNGTEKQEKYGTSDAAQKGAGYLALARTFQKRTMRCAMATAMF